MATAQAPGRDQQALLSETDHTESEAASRSGGRILRAGVAALLFGAGVVGFAAWRGRSDGPVALPAAQLERVSQLSDAKADQCACAKNWEHHGDTFHSCTETKYDEKGDGPWCFTVGVCPTGHKADGAIADGSKDERYWKTCEATKADQCACAKNWEHHGDTFHSCTETKYDEKGDGPWCFTVGVCPTGHKADGAIADGSKDERYWKTCEAPRELLPNALVTMQ